jgi:hypothetical protein
MTEAAAINRSIGLLPERRLIYAGSIKVQLNAELGVRSQHPGAIWGERGAPGSNLPCPDYCQRKNPVSLEHSSNHNCPQNFCKKFCDFHRRYSVFFEVRADLAWVARSISGGGCCSPAIAHQTLT